MRQAAARVSVSLLVAAVVLSVGLPARSQGSGYWQAAQRIREEGFSRSRVMDYAWHLTDVIGPRVSGSANLRESQEWALSTMQQIGLDEATIDPWGEHGVNWDVEYVSLHMLEPDYQPLIGYPQGFTVGTNGKISGQVVIADISSGRPGELSRRVARGHRALHTPAAVWPAIPTGSAAPRPGIVGDLHRGGRRSEHRSATRGSVGP